jgi:hypothetical protein
MCSGRVLSLGRGGEPGSIRTSDEISMSSRRRGYRLTKSPIVGILHSVGKVRELNLLKGTAAHRRATREEEVQ